MSIKYNRQYKVAAPDNEEAIGFLDGEGVYLGGGGPSGGGGGSTGGGNSGGGTGGGTGDGNTGGDVVVEEPIIPLVDYEIAIGSNLENEVGDLIKLKYEIRSSESVLDSDEILLADGSTDNKSILESLLKDNVLNIYLENTLPSNYSIVKIYYTDKQTAINYPSDYTKWKVGNTFIGQQATELKRGVAVAVILEKEISVAKPVILLESSTYTKQIKDSDTDSIINIKFTKTDCDFVDFYIATDKKIRVNASNGFVSLSFKNDFSGVFGSKKIIVVPGSDLYGTGDKLEILLNFISVNDFPSITEIVYTDSIDIPAFSDLNIEYDVKYSTFSTSFIDVDLVLKDNTKITLFKKLNANGSFKINIKELAAKFNGWNGSDNVTLILKPINNLGENELIGNEYEIKTNILYPLISLDEDIIKKSIYDAFIEKIQFLEPERESKYLTHLINFGDDEKSLVSSWEEDNWTLSKKSVDELGNEIVKPEDEVKSLILKLYNPLPSNVTSNSTFWITKLMSNPLIETIVLNEQSDLICPPLKGPNFSIDIDFVKGQSTGYESLDTLILSASTSSSTQLVATYLSSSLINTDELNIEYYLSGSTDYAWDNFVHFSSAKERVDNFIYKVQLIEKYEELIVSSSTNYTGGNSGSYTGSLSSLQESERQRIKKQQLEQGFDGFEKFLYTSSSKYTTTISSSITWPYSNNNRLNSTNTEVKNWYTNIITLAEEFDIENTNYVLNNIPQYIRTDEENDSLLLFFSMIGQHFDNIYFHTKAIERTRNLGYQSKNGISNKLLFDVLKSFNWDAKNLAADSKLWEYIFGMDSDGNQKFESPAKQRTYEVWRRIINNLPYLLKHKGTRRGIYTLMACYGIPSSNLSILEFGGPEVTETTKSKLVYDNITTALKMNLTSSIHMGWGLTNNTSSLRPNTIEFFIKPHDNLDYTLISGSGWNVSLTASAVENLGYVAFNYDTTNSLTSPLLPIFNGQFFGISVSSGSAGLKLDVRQSNKERTIFQESITASVASNWNVGNSIKFGGNYSGSVDEFRMWSSQLNTERFYEHVSFPEMINGNDVFGSTDELHFRLDFEYPKNLAVSQSLINVDTNIYYPSIQLNPSSSLQLTRNILEETGSINFDAIKSENPYTIYSASAIGFANQPTAPYNFEVIDRTVVLEIPDLGGGRYSTNKVRFESQTDFNGNDVSGGIDLSIKSRATKKSLDQAPTDSNRVGLFFSPTKELNIDIAKSLGGINLDNYIGDPGDRTKSNYKSLDTLRNYYFQRFDGRDIYAYINLIKLYEKSMFEDIKKMLPARVKATTGLLIEPHILERSKIAQKDPTGEEYQKETTIHYGDTTILSAENSQYESVVDANLSENLTGENNQYESVIDANLSENLIADSYQYNSLINDNLLPTTMAENYQQNVTIDARLDLPTILTEVDLQIDTFGQTEYETIGFGIYAEDGHAIRTYFDKNGRRVKERIKVNLVKEEKTRKINVWNVITPDRKGDPRGGMRAELETYYETKLYIQPYSGSTTITAGKNNIVQVTAVDGYLPTHYRNTSDLTTGLQNSFFRGSKNTAATTLDGSSPVETFISNPTTLTVNKTGRNTAEPILEVE
jgi:hypothetical protein